MLVSRRESPNDWDVFVYNAYLRHIRPHFSSSLWILFHFFIRFIWRWLFVHEFRFETEYINIRNMNIQWKMFCDYNFCYLTIFFTFWCWEKLPEEDKKSFEINQSKYDNLFMSSEYGLTIELSLASTILRKNSKFSLAEAE